MKYPLYNNIRLYRIARATILALRGQSTAKVVVVLRSAAVEYLTGLSARSPLIR